jgi:hypothetical protein
MTLIIGIPCASGIVLSADGMAKPKVGPPKTLKDQKVRAIDGMPCLAFALAGYFEIDPCAGPENAFDGRTVVEDYLRSSSPVELIRDAVERCALELKTRLEVHLNTIDSSFWREFEGKSIQIGLFQVGSDGVARWGRAYIEATPAGTLELQTFPLRELHQHDQVQIAQRGENAGDLVKNSSALHGARLIQDRAVRDVDFVTAKRVSRQIVAVAKTKFPETIGGETFTHLLERDKCTLLERG